MLVSDETGISLDKNGQRTPPNYVGIHIVGKKGLGRNQSAKTQRKIRCRKRAVAGKTAEDRLYPPATEPSSAPGHLRWPTALIASFLLSLALACLQARASFFTYY